MWKCISECTDSHLAKPLDAATVGLQCLGIEALAVSGIEPMSLQSSQGLSEQPTLPLRNYSLSVKKMSKFSLKFSCTSLFISCQVITGFNGHHRDDSDGRHKYHKSLLLLQTSIDYDHFQKNKITA